METLLALLADPTKADPSTGPTDWPPALTYFAVFLAVGAVVIAVSIYRRARRGLRQQRRR